jgi:predicted lipoprotein
MQAGKELFVKSCTRRKRDETVRPKSIFVLAVWIVVGIGLIAAVWTYGFTVVSIAEVQKVEQSEAFDPVKYVDGIWASKIIPTISDKAVDLSTILNAMHPNADGFAAKGDLIPVANKYGLITVGEAHVYMVKGTGQVVNVDTSSSTGTMEIQLEGYSGPIKILVYIGPRIPSDETSVRDGVGFINFGDFKEQTQYGKVGQEINNRIITEVLTPLGKDQFQGKTVTFYGAMTIRTFNLISINLKKVAIVPIRIEVKE